MDTIECILTLMLIVVAAGALFLVSIVPVRHICTILCIVLVGLIVLHRHRQNRQGNE